MKVTVTSPNLKNVVGGLKALVNRIPIAAKQSSRLIANQILDDSLNIAPKCPKDTGRLRETGRVEPVKEGYAVIYGGKTAGGDFVDYAAYVHDDLRPRKYKLPGSGPKFVETHFHRRSETAPAKISEILQNLADEIFREYR